MRSPGSGYCGLGKYLCENKKLSEQGTAGPPAEELLSVMSGRAFFLEKRLSFFRKNAL
jgi:hypothetical protein